VEIMAIIGKQDLKNILWIENYSCQHPNTTNKIPKENSQNK
jgi:hypothetical protein